MLTEHYVLKVPTERYERAFRLEAEWLRSKAHLESLSRSANEFVITLINSRTQPV
jgi:PHD/YefM family antitoxin component YafN of YafNO toxin-antitoxin module